MKRLIIITILLLAGLSAAAAQTENEPAKPEQTKPEQTKPEPAKPEVPKKVPNKPATGYVYQPIRKGDQFISIGVGIEKSLFNIAPGGIVTETNLKLGGGAAFGYSRFINSKIALGGELCFGFNSTLGNNMFFYLPITFKTTYEMVFSRIHIPLSLGAGFAFQTYNDSNYFGLILKPEAGVYFQLKPEWSFGATATWNYIPEWCKDKSQNRTGNILSARLGVRYHF